MDLPGIPIPRTSQELIEKLDDFYYHDFYLEMVRMSNANLNSYIDKFLDLLISLTKRLTFEDTARASIGVMCLHMFGFRDFEKLALVFDRVLPQTDVELVKFTSYCAGRLINHPNSDQSRYSLHLCERAIGWIRAKGRRARMFAAARLLSTLAENAGSWMITLLPVIKPAIWRLMACDDVVVLNQNASILKGITVAINRYASGDLDTYVRLFDGLCRQLVAFGSPIRTFAGLEAYRALISKAPDFFVKDLYEILDICANTGDEPDFVKVSAIKNTVAIARVDQKSFGDICSTTIMGDIQEVLLADPKAMTKCLRKLLEYVPEFCHANLNQVKGMIKVLVEKNLCDYAFDLLGAYLLQFNDDVRPFYREIIDKLLDAPLTVKFKNFLVRVGLAKELFCAETKEKLSQRLKSGLSGDGQVISLKIAASLPPSFFADSSDILELITKLASHESYVVRCAVPSALFNVALGTGEISGQDLMRRMLKKAVFDQNLHVRDAYLKVVLDNCEQYLGANEFMHFFEIFLNDDAYSVREITLDILSKLSKYNPVMVSSLSRASILNYFFILKNIPSIRQRARVARILPSLISSSLTIVKSYSQGLIEILQTVLQPEYQNQKCANFFDQNSLSDIQIGVVESTAIIAPHDPGTISRYSDSIIPLLCSHLVSKSHRRLVLAILKTLLIMLSPPAATVETRRQSPEILSVCLSYLAETRSRKARIAILKVIGAIGVLEVHRKPPPKSCESPRNVDDALARQFYHPFRDTDDVVDESLLLTASTHDQYNTAVVARALLFILNDDAQRELYVDTISALVEVLAKPRMHSLGYFDAFVARILDILTHATDEEMKSILPLYSQLIEESSNNTIPFLERSLDLIDQRWNEELMIPFLDLILSFLYALWDAFCESASRAICLLIECLDCFKTTNREVCRRVLEAFSILGQFAADYRYLIVPQICDAIDCEQTLRIVKIISLETLCILVENADLRVLIGPVLRSLSNGLANPDDQVKEAAQQLLYSLILSHGFRQFLDMESQWSDCENEHIRKAGAMSEVDIKRLQRTRGSHYTKRIHRPPVQSPKFAEEAVVSRADISMPHELQALVLTVISNSPSKAIRACMKVANACQPLAMRLFAPAFLSCWTAISENGRKLIANSFHRHLLSKDNYDSTTRDLLNLLVFMDKTEQPLDIPIDVQISSAIGCGCDAFAMYLLERVYEHSQDAETVFKLIDVSLRLGNWINAVAIWQKCSCSCGLKMDTEVFAKLKMWDKAELPSRDLFEKTKTPTAFYRMLHTLSRLGKWSEMLSFLPVFNNQSRQVKQKVAKLFAEAALHLGKWDSLDYVLSYAPHGSFSCNMFTALSALHNHEWEKVDECLAKGFSLLASRPISFWDDEQRIHRNTMLAAQKLIELHEMKQWLMQPALRESVETLWSERLTTSPREFELWLEFIVNRVTITQNRDESLIKFFELKSISLGTKMHRNAFEIIFPDFNFETASDVSKFTYAVAKWNIGEKEKALQIITKLKDQISPDLRFKCIYRYAVWILDIDDSVSALKRAFTALQELIPAMKVEPVCSVRKYASAVTFESVMPKNLLRQASEKGSLQIPNKILNELVNDVLRIDVLRKWAEVNTDLSRRDPDADVAECVNNAINALTACARVAPSFSDVVQLLNIFFEHADQRSVFACTGKFIKELDPKLLLQASPQLLVQLSHKSRPVAELVNEIIFSLLPDHYHSLLFSLLVLEKSNDGARARAAMNILNKFELKYREVYYEVQLIRTSLLRAAITWYEKCLIKLADAQECEQRNDIGEMIYHLSGIIQFIQKPKCLLHKQFILDFDEDLQSLAKLLQEHSQRPNQQSIIREITQLGARLQVAVDNAVKSIKIIQLASISEELCNKTSFNLAVPGTYAPNHPVIHIEYFVGQFGVYMSKQQPKNVVIKGSDGNFYQYLLKGHEDLRLDERIMQFFKLINSLVKKESSLDAHLIQTTSVIPLSLIHGLVQWVRGTDTLKAIVEQYRTLHGQEATVEYDLIGKLGFSRFDTMLPIQKMQIMSKIVQLVPDTDLANFFWLKASSAETWMKQSTTFAVSTAISSSVGYIIGLGDRHPSNLLIDRFSGKVIHIDFGDCFERAEHRDYLPEVVPFRLTRMMVKAMGVTGVGGAFRSAFVNMSQLLRDNRQTLLMVLAIFVQEPLVDAESEEDLSSQQSSGMKRSVSVSRTDEKMPPIHRSMSKMVLGQAAFDDGHLFYGQQSTPPQRSDAEIRIRVREKLVGTDFGPEMLNVEDQATRLIEEATSLYNLSRMYHGWAPLW